MFHGELVAIFLAGRKRHALQQVDRAEVVQGRGLRGDRYFRQEGIGKPDQEVTLIEIEALRALGQEYGISLEPGQARRNLVTCGVPLNHLVGQDFLVGSVRLRGLLLCEPCKHLEMLTVLGVKKGLCHRGGLRAQVLQGGMILKGDAIRPSSVLQSSPQETVSHAHE